MIYFENSKRIHTVNNLLDSDKHSKSVCSIIKNVDAEAFLIQKTEGNNFVVYTGEIIVPPQKEEVKDDGQKNEKVKPKTKTGGTSGQPNPIVKRPKRSKNRDSEK